MDDLQFRPAQRLRDAFMLDQRKLGPICRYAPGKTAAVVMSVDDVFPGKSNSAYEAGGDLERGAFGRLLWLLERHPQLRLTLFVTPDWRRISAAADACGGIGRGFETIFILRKYCRRERWTFATIKNS